MRYGLVLMAALLLWTGAARAEEQLLAVDNGNPEHFENLATEGHFVQLDSPSGWGHTFSQELSFYGHRYGNVEGRRGTLIIWSRAANAPAATRTPRPGRIAQPEVTDAAGNAVIHLRTQFDLAAVPEQPGWFSVPLDSVELPRQFGVSLFTFSTPEGGVNVALSTATRMPSRSTVGHPAIMAASPLVFRRDGRNWMIRVMARDSLRVTTDFTSAQLSGPKFAVLDDGSAEGFATSQRDGPMVRFTSDGTQRLRRAYIFGKLEGNWFNTDREVGVWLLDGTMGILWHGTMPYRQYTNVPSWGFIELPDMVAPRVYHIVVEPVSRPTLGFMIGYDSSGRNNGSLFGNAGAPQIWAIDAPEDRTNWMIRVEYR